VRSLVFLSLTAVTALGSRYLHANVDDGEEQTLLLMPFKTPYLLKVRIEAKEKHLGRIPIKLRASVYIGVVGAILTHF
jgi:hypothetical protein